MARMTPAVVRTLDILELFLDGPTALSMADIVARTELPRSSVHELLRTLVSRGYLTKHDESGQFTLGVKLLHLGNAYAERFDLLGAANVAARALSDELQETASVGIRRGASVFYLAKIEARALFQIPSGIGQSLPANCTGIGKALLSALTDVEIGELYPDPDNLPVMTARSIRTLPDLRADLATTRERGYAIEDGESTPGLHCAASVVRDVQGAVVAAISTSVPDVRWVSRSDAEWAAPVLAAAAELSAQLGYRAP